MRVSTAYAFARSQEEISQRQAQLARAQDQLSTGLKVQTPSDDPYAASQAERSRSLQARIEIERRASGFARSSLGSLEGALGNSADVLQEVRAQMLGAGNGAMSMSDRLAVATQLQQMRSELLGIANRADGSGGYLFGGQGSRVPPFSNGSPVTYQAQPGAQTTGQEMASEITVDGAAAFTNVGSSVAKVNLFSVMDSTIQLLKDASIPAASLGSAMHPLMSQLDLGLDGTLTERAKIGERLRALDNHDQYLDATEQNTKSYSAQITEVDLAKAISELNAQQTNLEAILKTYSQISRMSLFNYIS